MAKPFDVATKNLVESDPLAWIRFLGLPGTSAEVIDADLSTVVAEADRILRVHDPDYLTHIEMQASYKVDMGDRGLLYNVVTHYKTRLPVETVVVLLRKEADGPAMTGKVAYGSLQFAYRIVRLWEKTPEELLSAPLALLPLAPLTNISASEASNVVREMRKRIDAEAPIEERPTLWTTIWLLLGLKYPPEFSRQLLQGALEMKESSTYQWILKEGREEGIAQGIEQGIEEGERRMLVLLAQKRLGEPSGEILAQLEKVSDAGELERLAERVYAVESWTELLS